METQASVVIIGGGAYGYMVRSCLAFAYVRTANSKPGSSLKIKILGEIRTAIVLKEAVWDSENQRQKA